MCEQCMAETVTIGEVVPGVILVQATDYGYGMEPGEFGLVECNDPLHTFAEIPRPDPCDGLSDDEVNDLSEEDTRALLDWIYDARRFTKRLQVDLNVGWRVVQACIKAGYDPEKDEDVSIWLFHRLGVLLQKWEQDQ